MANAIRPIARPSLWMIEYDLISRHEIVLDFNPKINPREDTQTSGSGPFWSTKIGAVLTSGRFNWDTPVGKLVLVGLIQWYAMHII